MFSLEFLFLNHSYFTAGKQKKGNEGVDKLKICKTQTLMILIETLKGIGSEIFRSWLSSVLSPRNRDVFWMRFLEADSIALNHAAAVLATIPVRLLEGGSRGFGRQQLLTTVQHSKGKDLPMSQVRKKERGGFSPSFPPFTGALKEHSQPKALPSHVLQLRCLSLVLGVLA